MSDAIQPSPSTDSPQGSTTATSSDRQQLRSLLGWIGAWAVLLLACSSARHLLFRSTAFDLGIYDQVVYLMSRGMPPISSFLGFHHMGNHAAFSVYPLAILYALHPSVYWLLIVQACTLSLGALPTWLLARQAGLSAALASAMATAYLLYPLIFNVNLFDFHPEVMALPGILTAIWLARAGKVGWFCAAIVFILGCKAVLSVTVAAMGGWLLVFERRRGCGAIALLAGLTWFILATQWVIPTFSGSEAAAVSRYSYLGDSVLDIARGLILNPGAVLQQIVRDGTVKYLFRLFIPLLWGLAPRHLTPLVAAFPALMLNILSEERTQRDLIHQYSLPILPFLLVAVIATLAAGEGLLRQRRWIVLWVAIAFFQMAKYSFFRSDYFVALDTWQASREAIALIQTKGGVLTDNYLGPHLTHRPTVLLNRFARLKEHLPQVDYVLLNVRHPWDENSDPVERTLRRMDKQKEFELRYEQDGIYLYGRTGIGE